MTETAEHRQPMMSEPSYWACQFRFADGSFQWIRGAHPLLAVNRQPLPTGAVECISMAPAASVVDWNARPGPGRLNPLVPLAKSFMERSEELGLKGKRRDNAAIEYFCGAVKALEFAGRWEDANHVAGCLVMILCVRGYSEVLEWATLPAYLGTTKAEG